MTKIIVYTNGKKTEDTFSLCKKKKLDKNLLIKFDKNPEKFIKDVKNGNFYNNIKK